MKKISIIATVILLFTVTSSFSQFLGEYKYFAIRFGATHSFLDMQPDSFGHFFYDSPIGDIQFVPTDRYFGYTIGYYGSLIFNYDFKNDNMGIVGGVGYKHYGISAKYETINGLYTMKEKYRVSSLYFPVYFKIGKKIYKKQRYFYAGVNINFNLSSYTTQEVSNEKRRIKLDKKMVSGKNVEAVLGYNYGFLNIEASYAFGGFLNKEYENILNGDHVKPFTHHPKGVFYIKTGINIPLNSWTQRKWYGFQQFIRRLFK